MTIYLWQRKTAVALFALAVSAAGPARLSARSPAESADAEDRRLARRGVARPMDAALEDATLADAYLGLGVYNYLMGTLPFAEKIFQYVVALPPGSRESGLEQLRRAAKEGELTCGEAKFYLGKDLSRTSEGAYAKSLGLFEELARDYPNNPLWPLVAASLKYRMGSKPESDALYRAVLERTAAERSDAERGVHRAARAALLAQHPDEKFGD